MPLFSRTDGDPASDVPPYRKILQVFGRRTASQVMFDQEIDVTETMARLRAYNGGATQRVTLFHLVMWGLTRAFAERPRLNRFTAGGRLYQRRGIHLSYSAKKAMHDDAPVVAIKREMRPEWSFAEMVAALAGATDAGRSDAPSATDKEMAILLSLPLFALRILIWLARVLDGWNLLPGAFIAGDPFFASAYVSNMGSLKMEACHHHLWDYGSIPIFCAIGQVRTELRRVAGEINDGLARRPGPEGPRWIERHLVTLKYTFDERIEDGLYCARALDLVRDAVEQAAMLPS